jgi:hypothetical protein
MPTVSYEPCSTWYYVLEDHKDNLRRVGYPALTSLGGGNGNICSIIGKYNSKVGFSFHYTNIITHVKDDGRFEIVCRNEGYGGSHSEPAGLSIIQKRSLIGGWTYILLFSERAPCSRCQQSLERWARTFERDIRVQYLVPYTDSDSDYIDIINKMVEPQPAKEAWEWVKYFRESFR